MLCAGFNGKRLPYSNRRYSKEYCLLLLLSRSSCKNRSRYPKRHRLLKILLKDQIARVTLPERKQRVQA